MKTAVLVFADDRYICCLREMPMELEDFAKRIGQHAWMRPFKRTRMPVCRACAEGRWEAAVSALKTVQLTPLLRELKQASAKS
jgi:hypothetical protein